MDLSVGHLDASAVSALSVEQSTLALWEEFLRAYFDGGSHALGMTPAVSFPKAVLRFQEAALPQPLAGHTVGISVVYVSPAKMERHWDHLAVGPMGERPPNTPEALVGTRQVSMHGKCAWVFFVRAAKQDQVTVAADRLYGLLVNAMATKPLAEKGIHKLRPKPSQMLFEGTGSPTADLGYRVRMLFCEGLVTYDVYSQSTTL